MRLILYRLLLLYCALWILFGVSIIIFWRFLITLIGFYTVLNPSGLEGVEVHIHQLTYAADLIRGVQLTWAYPQNKQMALMDSTLNQWPVLVVFRCCSPYRKVTKNPTQYHISFHVWFLHFSAPLADHWCLLCRSPCVPPIPCCDRLHRGCSPSIHVHPSPSVTPVWHHCPDFLPICLSFGPVMRLHLPPVGLMLSRCDRSHVNLQVSPLPSSPGSCSLPSSSQLCWKCKCVCGSSGGWSRYLWTQDPWRCCRISSPLHVASSASLPRFLSRCQSLRKWELCGPRKENQNW